MIEINNELNFFRIHISGDGLDILGGVFDDLVQNDLCHIALFLEIILVPEKFDHLKDEQGQIIYAGDIYRILVQKNADYIEIEDMLTGNTLIKSKKFMIEVLKLYFDAMFNSRINHLDIAQVTEDISRLIKDSK